MKEFPIELALRPGDPGYSDSWGLSTQRLGRVTFPPNPDHGGRRVRFFATPEDQKLVLELGNHGYPAGGKQPLAVPTDIIGRQEKARLNALIDERLAWHGLLKIKTTPEAPFTSPHAAKLARESGVDLALIAGTGEDGQITIQDVRTYLER